MFEQIFKKEIVAIPGRHSSAEKLWDELATHYSGKARHYHNLIHLDNVIGELLPLQDRIKDWQTLVFSVAWHDVIYDTSKTRNEERSADFAEKRLGELGLSQQVKEKCKQQILFTKSHQASDDSDTNYFIDADLSILGADAVSYLEYTRQIRKEYRLYPDLLYKPGRRKVLRGFLAMESVFKTGYFREKYEERSRMNMSSELKSLS